MDAPDLRGRVLDAALACYAGKGMAATSLRDIAIQAGVTPALLHYYYGDKAQLQEAVIEERLLPAFQGMQESLQQAGDSLDALITAFVDGVARTVACHPWLPPLWIREVVSEGGALRDLLLTRVASGTALMMAQRFASEQRRGRLNPGLDPRLLMVSLIGLTLFPMAGAPIWRRLFDADDLDASDLRAHTLALLDRGLELKE